MNGSMKSITTVMLVLVLATACITLVSEQSDSAETDTYFSYQYPADAGATLAYRVTGENTVEAVDNINVSGLANYSGDVVVPDTVEDTDGNEYVVVGIGDRFTYTSYQSINSVTMPENSDSFTYIGTFAFAGVQIAFKIPDSVVKIGTGAFQNTAITGSCLGTGSQLKDIGSQAFQGCSALRDFTLPDTVESIGANAFNECPNLNITIPAGAKLADGTFNTAVKDITFAEGSIYAYIDGVLYNKQDKVALDALDPESAIDMSQNHLGFDVEVIASQCFNNKGIGSIVLPETLKEIGQQSFFCCYNLTEISIPASVEKIGSSAFAGVNIPVVLPGVISNSSALEKVTFENGSKLRELGDNVFTDCSELNTIQLPDSLESIGARTFFGCESLSEVIVPDTLKSIGSGAFTNCSSLESISLPEGCSVQRDSFVGTTATVSIGDETFIVSEEGDLDQCVAMIGEIGYPTLEKAAENAKAGDTINLVKSVTLTDSRPKFTVAVNLDLGGNTITINGTGTSNVGLWFESGENTLSNGHIIDNRQAPESKSVFSVYATGSGTSLDIKGVDIQIKNSVEANSYSVAALVSAYASMILGSGFKVTATGDTQEGSGGSVGVMIQGASGTGDGQTTLTVLDGVDIHTNAFAISGNGLSGYTDTTINIQGGYLTSDVAAAIYHPQTGTMDIRGGNITGITGIEIRSGDVSITGGTIVGNGNPFNSDPNGNGSTTTGAGIAIVQHTTKNQIDVNISGGEVSGYRAVYEANQQNNSDEDIAKIDISITGGDFKAINGGDEAVHIEDNEIIGDIITGGTFNTPVTKYMPDGLETTTDPDTGEIVVMPPVRFETAEVWVLTTEYRVHPVLTGGATITSYEVINGTGLTIDQNGNVTFTPTEESVTATIRVTATMDGTEYYALLDLFYDGAISITSDADVTLVSELIEEPTSDMMESLEEIDLPEGATLDPFDWLFFDVYRADESTEGVTFRLNMATESISSMSIFVVHFGDVAEQVNAAIGDGYIEIHATSFSPFGICIYTPVESGTDYPSYPWWDDDDEYVPPIVPAQPEDSGNDTTTIVACAAAAVVAALMAAFLILDRRH